MNLSTLELTNHWLPLIWVCAAGVILNMLPKKTELVDGRAEERWFWFSALVLIIPLVIWAGARTYIGDTSAYRRHFYQAPSNLLELPAYLATQSKDKGFTVLIVLIKSFGVADPKIFFTIIAALQMWGMVFAFRKYAPNYWVCIFLFVASTDYVSWMFNGMRQFLAATIIFSASGLLFRGKMGWFCLVVALASQIHASALLMIPLAFVMQGKAMNRMTYLMILGTVLLMPLADQFMPLLTNILSDTQYGDITTDEIWTNDDGTNMIRVLVYSVPALIVLFGRRYITTSTNRIMNICVNGAFATMAMYLISAVTSGIYVGRLPIYTTFYGYMALPWILEQIFEKETCRLILLLMVVCYSAFYYFQLGMTWGML